MDTTIYKIPDTTSPDTDTLQTRVYFKDTDTHQLLHKLSFHPRHTFTGVLKAQLLPFKRISSSYSNYSNPCSTLFAALQKCNYSKSLLRKIKRDIWYTEHDISKRTHQNKKFFLSLSRIRLRNDLYSVEWGVKLYSLTHSSLSRIIKSVQS